MTDPDASELRSGFLIVYLLFAAIATIGIAVLFAVSIVAASSSASNPGLVAGLIGSGQSGTPPGLHPHEWVWEGRESAVGSEHYPARLGGGVPPHPRALVPRTGSEGGTMSPTTPMPAAQLGTALIGGTSTWYCHDGSGGYPASRCTRGYEPGDLIAAAGSELPWGKGERVVVSRGDASVVVTIVDVCACAGSRVIDLSAAAFRELGSLGEGVIDVEVTSLPDLPATDTEEP